MMKTPLFTYLIIYRKGHFVNETKCPSSDKSSIHLIPELFFIIQPKIIRVFIIIVASIIITAADSLFDRCNEKSLDHSEQYTAQYNQHLLC